jgi:protein-histidine pros-kinase
MDLSGKLAIGLLNAAPDATVIVDTRGVIVFANALVDEVFGYEPSELLDRPIEILLPDRFRAGHIRHRSGVFQNSTRRPMGTGLELYGLRKDGREFPVEISLSPLETGSGLLVSSSIRDITDRRAAEGALIEARNDADRANRAKSAFLAAASHDLRQPLQALSLLNAALVRIAEPKSRVADIAAGEAEALTSMSELLNSLLNISTSWRRDSVHEGRARSTSVLARQHVCANRRFGHWHRHSSRRAANDIRGVLPGTTGGREAKGGPRTRAFHRSARR